MNFKTTFVLLIVLAGLGAYIFFSKAQPKSDVAENSDQTSANERAVFDVKPEDIVRISVTPSEGKPTVLQKTDAKWKLLKPVAADADEFAVDTLARDLTGLKSHATVSESSQNAAATGLANPHYKIEFATKDKTYKIDVGQKLAVGDNLYVSIDGAKNADVVNTSLLDQLEKPASTYRDAKLVKLTSTEVKRVTIQRGKQTIALEKDGTQWRETQPQQFAADETTVDDLLYPLAGLRATDWVAENDKDAADYQLDHPRITVTLSATTRPSTRPAGKSASTQPKATIIRFGRYDDILKKNVLVSTSDTPAIAKVSATVLDSLDKKPLDFRDKNVLKIDPKEVSRLALATDTPAMTKPTTKPAHHSELTIRRHQPVIPVGVAAPSTAPTTRSASARPAPATHPMALASTRPAEPATRPSMASAKQATHWEIVTGPKTSKPADDSKVTSLLDNLNPLRAERYLESNPAATQPAATTYTLTITTQGAGGATPVEHTIKIIDPGESKTPVGACDGLTFEVARDFVDQLRGNFAKSAADGVARK